MATATTKPPKIEIQRDNIPLYLRNLKRWVVWRWVLHRGEYKKSGPKKTSNPSVNAASDQPGTWSDFDHALAQVQLGKADGIGIIAGDVDNESKLVFIDLDDCVEDGEVFPDAYALLVKSGVHYAEVSPSGTGYKGIALASLELWQGKKHGYLDSGAKVEVFTNNQPFYVTGKREDLRDGEIVDATTDFEALLVTVDALPNHRGGEDNSDGNANQKDTAPAATSESNGKPRKPYVKGDTIPANVEDALSALAPRRCDDDHAWIKVGQALHAEGDGFLPLWDQWSRQSGAYDPDACEAKWATFSRGGGTTIAAVFQWAKDDSPGWIHPAQRGKKTAAAAKSEGKKGANVTISDAPEIRNAGSEGRRKYHDDGNALRLVDRFGADLYFVPPWNKWLVWNEGRWKVDDLLGVQERAKSTVRDIAEEANELEGDARKALLQHWHTSHGKERLRAMQLLAQSDRRIARTHEVFDSHPWLLNCANGTVDLKTGKLLPHRRENMLTKTTDVAVADRGAQPAKFLKFLDEIFASNQRLIDYVQELFGGPGLCGVQNNHLFPVLHGGGSNGKSVLINTVLNAIGEYGMVAAPKLFMQSTNDEHPTIMADLFGKRITFMTESNDSQKLNEALVKRITGGEDIKARYMRGDYFQFPPTWLAGLSTNHKPDIDGTDHGIWRRVKYIPFTVTIPDDKQNPHLEEELKGELPSILRWFIDGGVRWYARGCKLEEPNEVRAATAEYRFESDQFSQWFSERVEIVEGARESAQVLRSDFETWCNVNAIDPRCVSAKEFKQRLVAAGGAHKKIKGRMWYGNLRLISDDDETDF